MIPTLILYSSVDGHTQTICQRLAQQLEQEQLEQEQYEVTLCSLDSLDLTSTPLDAYEKIIIGASIRYGKHRANVGQFITDNRGILHAKKSAIFSVNLVARKAEKNTPESNPYLQKLLLECDWQPSLKGIFAGKVDYQQYRFFDRQMIRMIMWMTNGPTALDSSIDYTDWQKVDAFAGQIRKL